jgi:hypothetical protein
MLFATDLDRTLIYSAAAAGALGAEGAPPCDSFHIVEHLDGQPLSYITDVALGLLHDLWSRVLVVPVTTRTLVQYRRIALFGEALVPEYAVAANGGHLIHRGVPDPDWSDRVRRDLGRSGASADEVAEELRRAGERWTNRVVIADGFFVYAVVDRAAIGKVQLDGLSGQLEERGWTLSLQGRKLYATPVALCKWAAIQEICRRSGETIVVAAGDSLLDRVMLEQAACGLRPAHGELAAIGHPTSVVTTASGILAAEELLRAVVSLYDAQHVDRARSIADGVL